MIDDLAGDLRAARDGDRETRDSGLNDPGKLVADDVILISNTKEEMQALLEAFTQWALKNRLDWKPAKCKVVADKALIGPIFELAGQLLDVKEEAKYLGLVVTMRGFKKTMDKDLENKAKVACTAITSQSFFGPGLPNSTLRTLFRTNLRSVLTYGVPLI